MCVATERVMRTWQSSTRVTQACERLVYPQNLEFEERYAVAERLKAKGNELFRKQQFKYAKARWAHTCRRQRRTCGWAAAWPRAHARSPPGPDSASWEGLRAEGPRASTGLASCRKNSG